jgi:hypothetical protein
VIDIENSNAAAKWSASSILSSTAKVNQAFGFTTPHGLNYIDLPNFQPEPNVVVKDDDFAFSFQVGLFAGFWNEFKFRDPAATLSTALKSFYAFTVGNSDDDRLNSIFTAGLIRIVEKTPVFSTNKFQIYNSVGLPGDADVSTFLGAESSGRAVSPVPNFKLRYLNSLPFGSAPTADTIFNSRGALVAHRLGIESDRAGFQYIGSGSVADVYGTSEAAIGRWNKGYYFYQGVQIDKVTGQLSTQGRTATALNGGVTYATGIPATNLPVCGKSSMSVKAKTKQLVGIQGSTPFVLNSSSKLGFQHANGATYVGYDISLTDATGRTLTFKSTGGADSPAVLIDSNMEFRSFDTKLAPSGETLELRGLLVGNGANSAVISISSNIRTLDSYGLAAVFEIDSPIQNCITPSFDRGSVNPIPVSDGFYQYVIADNSPLLQGLAFFPDGTPNSSELIGVTQNASYEKSGNAVAGIGIMVPPFSTSNASGEVKVPSVYIYRKVGTSGSFPATGVATYKLIASTSFLVSTSPTLISVDKRIKTAQLKVYFDQFPVGMVSPDYGSCQLSVNGETETIEGIFYSSVSGGYCGVTGGNIAFEGGVSSADSRYAVVRYTRYRPPYREEVGLLFERESP